MKTRPFIAIGNEELKGTLKKGDIIRCPKCRKRHSVCVGKDRKTGKETDMVLFYHCGKKLYLAGIDGKSIL
jgi:hypothetical protein